MPFKSREYLQFPCTKFSHKWLHSKRTNFWHKYLQYSHSVTSTYNTAASVTSAYNTAALVTSVYNNTPGPSLVTSAYNLPPVTMPLDMMPDDENLNEALNLHRNYNKKGNSINQTEAIDFRNRTP